MECFNRLNFHLLQGNTKNWLQCWPQRVVSHKTALYGFNQHRWQHDVQHWIWFLKNSRFLVVEMFGIFYVLSGLWDGRLKLIQRRNHQWRGTRFSWALSVALNLWANWRWRKGSFGQFHGGFGGGGGKGGDLAMRLAASQIEGYLQTSCRASHWRRWRITYDRALEDTTFDLISSSSLW